MNERYANLATRLLAERARTTAPPSLGERAATVTAVEGALRGRARRRIVGRLVAGAGLATLVALLPHTFEAPERPPAPMARVPERPPAPLARAPKPIATASAAGPEATLVRAGMAAPLGQGASLEEGDRIGGNASIGLVTGTSLALHDRGDLELRSLGAVQQLELHRGRLRAEVAKLQPGHRFLVQTDDAEVEVRGTSFEVAVAPRPTCANGGRTAVRVFEGVVTVRRDGGEVRLRAGESWPPACATHATAMLRPTRTAPAVISAPSTLADQNDLFLAALRARNAGDAPEARRYLDELIDRFPSGPLVESARAERDRLPPPDGP